MVNNYSLKEKEKAGTGYFVAENTSMEHVILSKMISFTNSEVG